MKIYSYIVISEEEAKELIIAFYINKMQLSGLAKTKETDQLRENVVGQMSLASVRQWFRQNLFVFFTDLAVANKVEKVIIGKESDINDPNAAIVDRVQFQLLKRWPLHELVSVPPKEVPADNDPFRELRHNTVQKLQENGYEWSNDRKAWQKGPHRWIFMREDEVHIDNFGGDNQQTVSYEEFLRSGFILS